MDLPERETDRLFRTNLDQHRTVQEEDLDAYIARRLGYWQEVRDDHQSDTNGCCVKCGRPSPCFDAKQAAGKVDEWVNLGVLRMAQK